MFDRTYQPGVAATPATVTDDEGERVQVWRPGFGWVDRPAETTCDPRCVLGPERDHPGYLEYRCIDDDVNALPFPGEVAS